MTELELGKYRDETYNRLVEAMDMSHEQANFVIALMIKQCSCEGAALMRINDFFDYIGI